MSSLPSLALKSPNKIFVEYLGNLLNMCSRYLIPSQYKQCTPPSWRKCQVSQTAPQQETYLAQTHIRKMETIGNGPHQNASDTWMQVKTLHSNKMLIYKAVLKPIWTCGIQLWCMASTSNIEILEHFQSKVLHMIVDASWYVPNMVIQRDLQTPSVTEQIRHCSSQYSGLYTSVRTKLAIIINTISPNSLTSSQRSHITFHLNERSRWTLMHYFCLNTHGSQHVPWLPSLKCNC
jgi:hypothetical protein